MAWLKTYISGTLQNWGHRLPLVIPASGITGSITSFPILVHLGESSGISNYNSTAIVDEITNPQTIFEDDFASLSGVGWETVPGYTGATYDQGYMYFGSTGYVEITSSAYSYGDNWEVKINYINRGLGSGDDVSFVNVYYDNDSAYAESFIRTYMRTYSSGDQWFALQYQYNSGSVTTLHTGTKYNLYTAAQSDLTTWAKVRKVGNRLFFKYWREDQSEPASWDYEDTPSDLADFNQPGKILVHGSTEASEGGCRVEYIKIDSANGRKVAIADSTGDTEQYVEISRYDPFEQELNMWTTISGLNSTSGGLMYLYYDHRANDNDSYVGLTGTAVSRNVWDTNFVAVYHFDQGPSPYILDSSQSAYHATQYGSMTASDLIDGEVTKAIEFDGGDDRAYTGTYDFSDLETAHTAEFKVNWVSLVNTWDKLLTVGPHDAGSIAAARYNGTNYYNCGVWSDDVQSDIDIRIDEWDNITYLFSSGTMYMYRDGVVGSVTNAVSLNGLSSTQMCLASRHDTTDNANLKFEEVRVSKIARSTDYLKTNVKSLADNLIIFDGLPRYEVEGYVREQGTPVIRTLYLIHRDTGTLEDTTQSDVTGYYNLRTFSPGEHSIICLDNVAGDDYNDLIISRITPTTISGV